MLRGEFRFANGLIVPNNVTTKGSELILKAALRGDIIAFWVGLCSAVYEPDLKIEDIIEPTIAVNGYARLAVSRDIFGWPSGGVVNGENYLESLPLLWTPVGGPFSQPVTRMFIAQEHTATAGDIIALSGAMPDDMILDTDTAEVDRTFKYRLYLR